MNFKYINQKSIKELEEVSLTTRSNLVKSWSIKYCINQKFLTLVWRRSELIAIKTKNCKCRSWALTTVIFKNTVRKYFDLSKHNKCNNYNKNKLKPFIKKGKYIKSYKDVEPNGKLFNKFKTEVRKLESELKKCKISELRDCANYM